ncbi:hypothetical protein XA68_18015 [Ophiocordyceps unilateralis]|uniref:Ketoreductase (KR) domain-containing protein n=1 Tax=Ophiocordyceps unilateralis TaxID=268505 RepID=A0A2A9PII6_OPHUN|nr:hypothetical protein XA68_18015 [Ophiocordyceps unilateralis]
MMIGKDDSVEILFNIRSRNLATSAGDDSILDLFCTAALMNESSTRLIASIVPVSGIDLVCDGVFRAPARVIQQLHVVLTSRDPTEDPHWITELPSTGSSIRVVKMDVMDRAQVRETATMLRRTMPELGSVSNAALVFKAGILANLSADDGAKQLKLRVDGTVNFDREFFRDRLDVGGVARMDRADGSDIKGTPRSLLLTPLSVAEFHHVVSQGIISSRSDLPSGEVIVGMSLYVDDGSDAQVQRAVTIRVRLVATSLLDIGTSPGSRVDVLYEPSVGSHAGHPAPRSRLHSAESHAAGRCRVHFPAFRLLPRRSRGPEAREGSSSVGASHPQLYRGIIFVGTAIPNTSMYIPGDDGNAPLPPGMPAEICVGGASVSRGYLDVTVRGKQDCHGWFDESYTASHGRGDGFPAVKRRSDPRQALYLTLIRLALPRRIFFQHVSVPRVTLLFGRHEARPVSMTAHRPPTDGSQGVTASKWASECLLEKLAREAALPVDVHRHCALAGERAPADAVMNSVARFSRLSGKVPMVNGAEGLSDSRDVVEVASEIASHAPASAPGPFSCAVIAVTSACRLADRRATLCGDNFEVVGPEEWLRAAWESHVVSVPGQGRMRLEVSHTCIYRVADAGWLPN